MKFWRLFKNVIVKNIREDRTLTVLSILGVGLGIGLFMGVNIATDRAIASFESSVGGIDPAFNYEIAHQSGTDFPEEVYKTVRTIAGKSLPVLTARVYLPAHRRPAEITGIYTPKAPGLVNSGHNAGVRNTGKDIETFFSDLNAILVTRRFSDELGVTKGELLTALVYNRQYRLRVAGILDVPSLPSGTLLMDLGNYQEMFGKTGLLSRLDIAADPGQADRIAQMLPPNLVLEKKEGVLRNRKALIDAFRLNLRFVTFLAVLVGVFLLYNTVFISVIKRRTEIGILRGLGMSRRSIVALFSAQGLLLGLAGSLLGVGLGRLSAALSTSAVSQTVTWFYGSAPVADQSMTSTDALWTVAFGLTVSFLSSLMPALESATVRPMESARAGTFERTSARRQRIFSMAGVILIFSGAVLIGIDYRFVPFSFPWLSHAGILLFILGCTLLAPAYLGLSLAVLNRPLRRLFKTIAPIAIADMAGTRFRFSLALMSVAVSSALIIAIVSSVFSLKQSFIDWINTYVSADVYVKAASCTSNFCYDPLPDKIFKIIARQPGVETVGRFRSLPVNFAGKRVVAGFGDSTLLWQRQAGVTTAEQERLQRLAQRPEVIVSEYLAVQYGLRRGDQIKLQTPKGMINFVVNNSSISYSTMSGFLYFDRKWLREYWEMDDATQLSVYLEKERDVPEFINRLRTTLAAEYALDITDNRELREAAIRIFDRSFAVTYSIELIAITISLIGVVNALMILVLERKRQISILRYLGSGWDKIRQMMMLSAATIGIAGIVLGCGMGAAISMVITHVINKISFGWEVPFQMPVLTLAVLISGLFVTTLLAGIVPFLIARKIDPKQFISFE